MGTKKYYNVVREEFGSYSELKTAQKAAILARLHFESGGNNSTGFWIEVYHPVEN